VSNITDLVASITEEGPDGYEGDFSFRSKKVGNYEHYVFLGPGIGRLEIGAVTPWVDQARRILGALHASRMAGYADAERAEHDRAYSMGYDDGYEDRDDEG
jgi:hypothetical protein